MTCPECNGSGRVIEEDVVSGAQNYSRFATPEYVLREVECESCGGWGEVEVNNGNDE
tara:strand:- start:287 stop:457 length:171 start_codon:yes stop_codon:yes gene_type:complete